MLSWNAKPDIRPTLAQNASLHAFGDPTGKIGRAYYDLGEIYRCFNRRTYNSSIPFQVLFWADKDATWKDVTLAEFEAMDMELERIKSEIAGDQMASEDAEIVRMELKHVLNMLALSAEIGKHKLAGTQTPDFESKLNAIEHEHQHVWLLRNRPGGLSDSTARLKDTDLQ
jgi:hexosaminidase